MANRSNRPHLLFFTSPRSGPGRRMESLLAQLAHREREWLRVSRVNVEERPALAERLGIAEIPTLVLATEGRPVARLAGRASAPQIALLLEPHLPGRRKGNPDRSLAA